MQKLKVFLKRAISEEKGMSLILVLVLLAFGSLIVAPLLNFMVTGMKTTYNVYDPKAFELYAADAGVREALWRIRSQDLYPLPSEDITTTVTGFPLTENGKNITVHIYSETIQDLPLYRVVSMAVDPVHGDQTSIETLVFELDFTSFVDKIITSPSLVPISPNTIINGNGHELWVPEGWSGNNVDIIDAPIEDDPILVWPTESSLIEFYSDQVDKTASPPPYINENGVIEVSGDMNIGSLYYEGDLTIKKSNTAPSGNITVNVVGTIYVKGTISVSKDITLNLYDDPGSGLPPLETTISDFWNPAVGSTVLQVADTTDFPSSGMILVGGANPEYLNYEYFVPNATVGYDLYLERQTTKAHACNDLVEVYQKVPNTIFVEGSNDTWNFSSTVACTINGPGAIIATGNIRFQPKVDADSGFIYIMALGTLDFQPATSSGEPSGFNGSAVGRTFNPVGSSTYTYPLEGYPLNLNIPDEDTPIIIGGISSWEIY